MCVKHSTEMKTMHAFSNYEVFLGGTCGQSTWRKDIAIPHLQRSGITFFNPQQDDWHPGLATIAIFGMALFKNIDLLGG